MSLWPWLRSAWSCLRTVCTSRVGWRAVSHKIYSRLGLLVKAKGIAWQSTKDGHQIQLSENRSQHVSAKTHTSSTHIPSIHIPSTQIPSTTSNLTQRSAHSSFNLIHRPQGRAVSLSCLALTLPCVQRGVFRRAFGGGVGVQLQASSQGFRWEVFWCDPLLRWMP